MNIPPIFKSRKFWAAFSALVIAIFGNRAGLDDQTVQNSIYTLIAFILGVGLEGFKKSG